MELSSVPPINTNQLDWWLQHRDRKSTHCRIKKQQHSLWLKKNKTNDGLKRHKAPECYTAWAVIEWLWTALSLVTVASPSVCVFVRQGSGLSPVAGVSSQCSVCSLAPLSTVACLRQITHTQEQMGADLSTHKYTKQGQTSWMYWIYTCVRVFLCIYVKLGTHKTCLFLHLCLYIMCRVCTNLCVLLAPA